MAARELGTILPALWPPWPSVGVGAGASCWAATGAARRESAAKAGSTPVDPPPRQGEYRAVSTKAAKRGNDSLGISICSQILCLG